MWKLGETLLWCFSPKNRNVHGQARFELRPGWRRWGSKVVMEVDKSTYESSICSMVLVYLPTKLGDFVRANVGKHTSTMEHMGDHPQVLPIIDGWVCSLPNWMVPMAQFQERRNREAMAEHQPRFSARPWLVSNPLVKMTSGYPTKKVGNVGKIYESSSCTLC